MAASPRSGVESEAGLLVSTRKGLLVGRSSRQRREWQWSELHFGGWIVDYAVCDRRTGALWCAANSWQWGPRLHRSDDGGRTWREAATPAFTDGERSLESIWTIEPGAREGRIYVGAMPAALFVSDDDGESWRELTALTQHPYSEHWEDGAAGLVLHHIGVDAQDPQRLVVAGSATGAFVSYDAGESWEPRNDGLRLDNLPPDMAASASCIHSLHAHPTQRGRLWQQNHFGQYRSDDDGLNWVEVGQDLPGDFGFASAIDPRDPDCCYYVPLDFDQSRMPRGAALAVYRTRDAGATWQALSNGLPQTGFYQSVYRHALGQDGCDPLGLYLGSSGGEVFASNNGGDDWRRIRTHLAAITAVRAWPLNDA